MEEEDEEAVGSQDGTRPWVRGPNPPSATMTVPGAAAAVVVVAEPAADTSAIAIDRSEGARANRMERRTTGAPGPGSGSGGPGGWGHTGEGGRGGRWR